MAQQAARVCELHQRRAELEAEKRRIQSERRSKKKKTRLN
jgi:uncharacterized small protein (DUF1192 family)